MADAPPVRFHYIKSNTYRVVHVDGVYGGPTPGKLLYVSFYNERFPIPNVIEHAATDIGGDTVALGEETRREGKDGVVREIDFGAIMTLAMAKKLHDWLGKTIRDLEAAPSPAPDPAPSPGGDTGGTDAG